MSSGIMIPYGSGLLSSPAPFGGAYLAGGICPKGYNKQCVSKIPGQANKPYRKNKSKKKSGKKKGSNKNWVDFVHSAMLVNPNIRYSDLAADPNIRAAYQARKLGL